MENSSSRKLRMALVAIAAYALFCIFLLHRSSRSSVLSITQPIVNFMMQHNSLTLPSSCTEQHPCHVLVDVASFIGGEVFRYEDRKPCKPGLDCRWASNRRASPDCDDRGSKERCPDAVAFHLTGLRSPPAGYAQSRIITVGASMESNTNYRHQMYGKWYYDLTMTYSMGSDVPIHYLPPGDQLVEKGVDISVEGRLRAAAFVASNCNKRRIELVETLIQEGLTVHSLGACRVNGSVHRHIGRRSNKVHALANYTHYLAFENSDSVDYVSEKVYDGLRAGAVPIYFGTTQVPQFVPNNSVLEYRMYNTTELVRLINRTMEPGPYAEMQEWRGRPFRPQFMRDIHWSSHCRVCEAVAALKTLRYSQLMYRRKVRRQKVVKEDVGE